MEIKERNIEDEFINQLQELKYIYRPDIRDRETLEQNFLQKFQELNRVKLSDNEFNRLLEQIITPNIFESSKLLRQTNTLERDDGTPLHYTLVNIKDWCKNSFEVINQLKINTKDSFHRYDVIFLINGLPLVQIELKTLQISPRRAIQQIINYKNDLGNGYTNTLLCFMQLFIVSNRSNTYYFANNDNKHFHFDADERFLPIYQYADKKNKKITQLYDFTKAFLSKCKLAQMISRYMVLVESEQKLMMMRPYQIYAVESIVECIDDNRGNGYIWHTTGSGKTLTSFKASTLLKDNDNIKKVLFVVDRKDLDRQTREEFNRFQENCVEENTNTHTLIKRLLSRDYKDKVIVTTIQKLGLALDDSNKNNYKERLKPLANERIVFIFDECHRSQFGKNNEAIKDFFPNAQLFGFTGTPIFEENAQMVILEDNNGSFKTTKDIFQKELHNYTITNAIDDGNVLRFHIDYFKLDSQGTDSIRVSKNLIVDEILDKHDKVTANKKFNALFATSSINDAIEYFRLFKTKEHNLNIACIFSPPAEGNRDIKQLQEDLATEAKDNQIEPESKKEALQEIIDDYNRVFKTNHSINNFDSYYQDVQTRIKNHKYPNSDLAHKEKIDITIVVDMLLTGFDSKFLNTLYIDKNLKYHGLIQAFSRTNRVLNDTKPYGNILDFRSQENAVDEAIALFSGEDINQSKKIWLVESVSETIDKFKEAIGKLEKFMLANGLQNRPQDVANLRGDVARAEFINTFKEIQRLKSKLDQRSDLKPKELETIESLISRDDLRAFKSMYLETAKRLKDRQDNQENTSKEIQELDFELVLFASTIIDYDYIMSIVAKYTSSNPKNQKISKEKLINLLKSDANFLDEQEELISYINSLEIGKGLSEDEIKKGYELFKDIKNSNTLDNLAKEYNLDIDSLKSFVNRILDRYIFDAQALTDLLAPLNLGWKERRVKEESLMKELSPLLRKMAKGRDISGLEVYDG